MLEPVKFVEYLVLIENVVSIIGDLNYLDSGMEILSIIRLRTEIFNIVSGSFI